MVWMKENHSTAWRWLPGPWPQSTGLGFKLLEHFSAGALLRMLSLANDWE